jgi:hypothetical protein
MNVLSGCLVKPSSSSILLTKRTAWQSFQRVHVDEGCRRKIHKI